MGYESYARMLELRVITQSWISYLRTKGRFVFKRMHTANDNNRIIGFEMTKRRLYGTRWSENDWMFRVYCDGTALYRKNALRSLLNRRSCFDPIDAVVREYYNLDTVIQGVGDSYTERYSTEMEFLRRKPLSPVLRNLAGQRSSLGQFLLTKYNVREGVAV